MVPGGQLGNCDFLSLRSTKLTRSDFSSRRSSVNPPRLPRFESFVNDDDDDCSILMRGFDLSGSRSAIESGLRGRFAHIVESLCTHTMKHCWME